MILKTLIPFRILVLALLVGQCIGGGRAFIKTELRNTPLGVGIRSALGESGVLSWKLSKQPSSTSLCRAESRHSSRYASVFGSERQALGMASKPYLKPNPSLTSKENGYQELVTCSSTTSTQEPLHISLTEHKELGDEESNSNIVYVSNGGRRGAPQRIELDTKAAVQTSDTRGGNALAAVRPLLFWENMVSGAVSRSVAQTVMHPANTMKTILQSSRGADRPTLRQLMKPENFKTLTRGAGANFILSVPHGAVNFAVLEFVRFRLNSFVESVPFLAERASSMGAGLDFMSSAISTVCCSIVSTPQMMITDNIMAGNYPRLDAAVSGLYAERGILGFYAGWWPGLVGKIPSYVSACLVLWW